MAEEEGGDPPAPGLTEAVVEEARAAEPEQAAAALAGALGLAQYRAAPREVATVEFLVDGTGFCVKAGLNVKQTHLFLGILLELLEVAKQQKPYDEAAQGLQAAILAHCAGEAAPDKFVLTDVKAMTGFLAKTFLAHYSLYTYVFTQEQDTTTITEKLLVQEAGLIPSLSTATEDKPPEPEPAEEEAPAPEEAAEEAAAEGEAAEAEPAEEEAEAEEAAAAAEGEEAEEGEMAEEDAIQILIRQRLAEEKSKLLESQSLMQAQILEKIAALEAKG